MAPTGSKQVCCALEEFLLPLARTFFSLLGLLLDVHPASLLGLQTLHPAPGVSVTPDGSTDGGRPR